MKRRGRRALKPQDKKDGLIAFRLRSHERALIEQRAEECDSMKLSEYARQMVLMDPNQLPSRPRKMSDAIQIKRDLILELNNLGNQIAWAGNNMNQVAMVLNATGDPHHKKAQDLELFIADFDRVKSQLETVMQRLAGYDT